MSERAFQVEEIKRGSQKEYVVQEVFSMFSLSAKGEGCLLYTSDAADDWLVV